MREAPSLLVEEDGWSHHPWHKDVGNDCVNACKQRCSVLNSPFDNGNRVIRILVQAPKRGGRGCWGSVRMSDCVQGIGPCECKGKGHQFQRVGLLGCFTLDKERKE